MEAMTIILWGVSAIIIAVSFFKRPDASKQALGGVKNMMKPMLTEIMAILLLIGLVLAIMPPSLIKEWLGGTTSIMTTVGAALVGSVTLIPAFVAFPLVGSIMDRGASIIPAVAFLTTLTMVGVVTFPIEASTFGKKFTIVRNLLSFAFAIAIALLMGVIL